MDETHPHIFRQVYVEHAIKPAATPLAVEHLDSYEEPGAEPTFVFIHGFAENRHVWMSVAPIIAPGYRRLFVDLRGHGGSMRADCHNYGVDADVEDVQQFLRTVTNGPIILVGHSLGGAIAMRLAANPGLLVQRLIVIDTSPAATTDASRHVRATLETALARRWTVAEYRQWLIDQRPLTPPAELSRVAESMIGQSGESAGAVRVDPKILEHRSARVPLEDVLWKIRCPTLLVRGALSGVLADQVARSMVRQMPNASLVTVDMAGHAVFADNQAGFCVAVNRWFAKHPLDGGTDRPQSRRST